MNLGGAHEKEIVFFSGSWDCVLACILWMFWKKQESFSK
jgi:hypothetical protein